MTKPDTSPENVARVLRKALDGYLIKIHDMDAGGDVLTPVGAEIAALADALDAGPSVTWGERVERLARHLESTCVRIHWGENGDARNKREYDQRADAALRIAFPEYAPKEPTP